MRQLVSYVVITLILCSFFCCRDANKEKPRNYENEKLIPVMIDLYTAEAALQDIEEEYSDSLRQLYRQQIAIIHDIDIALVEEDLEELQSDLVKYEAVHKVVKDSIYAIEKRESAVVMKNAKKFSGKKAIKKQFK